MIVAMIHSKENAQGYWELEVHMDEEQLLFSADPQGVFEQVVRQYLHSAIFATGIPAGVGIWMVEFSPEVRKMFNLPEGVVL